jgi:hypothetical protein
MTNTTPTPITKRADAIRPGDLIRYGSRVWRVDRVDPPAHFRWYLHLVVTDTETGHGESLCYGEAEHVTLAEVRS